MVLFCRFSKKLSAVLTEFSHYSKNCLSISLTHNICLLSTAFQAPKNSLIYQLQGSETFLKLFPQLRRSPSSLKLFPQLQRSGTFLKLFPQLQRSDILLYSPSSSGAISYSTPPSSSGAATYLGATSFSRHYNFMLFE